MKYYAISKHDALHFLQGTTKTGLCLEELQSILIELHKPIRSAELFNRINGNQGTLSIRIDSRTVVLITQYEL